MFLTGVKSHRFFSLMGHRSILLIVIFSLALSPIKSFAQECQDCQQGGEGKGGGGGKAADILFGLAAIMAAVAPMVAAAVQADADKQIAKTNADAQIQMTEISASTSKQLAEQQKEIALQQAETAKNISEENQQATTERLQVQLAELRSARQEANAIEQQKREYAQELDAKRFTLAQQQAEASQQLANAQLRAQLTAAGLSQGFTRSQDSGSGITRTVAARNTGLASANSTSLGSVVKTATSAKTSLGIASTTSKAVASTGAGLSTNRARGISKLMGSLGDTGGDDEEEVVNGKVVKKAKKPGTKATTAKGVAATSFWQASRGVTVGKTLTDTLTRNRGVRGSTTTNKYVAVKSGLTGNDLSNFVQTTRSRNDESFSVHGLAGRGASRAPTSLGEASGHKSEEGFSGSYNPPTMESSSHRGLAPQRAGFSLGGG